MLLGASISSWNTPAVNTYLKYGQRCLECKKSISFSLFPSVFSKWRLWIFQLMAAYTLPTPPLTPASKQSFAPGFCIGPHCGTRYWDCNAGEPRHYDRVEPNKDRVSSRFDPPSSTSSADLNPHKGLTSPPTAMVLLTPVCLDFRLRTPSWTNDLPTTDLFRSTRAY